MPGQIAFVTIIAKNYLPFARVLMASLKDHCPEALRFVVTVDSMDGYFDPSKEDFETIPSSDLGIPNSAWFNFKYSVLELSTAIKPYALEHLIERFHLDRIIYLDPDIRIYRPLDNLIDLLDSANIVLTPHLTGSLNDGRQPGEIDILRSGVYNLGFLALAARPEVTPFLKWWQDRVYDHCVVDLARGLFVDQRWVDLVPGMFPGVFILREPGYNVAYWNLAHRDCRREDGEFRVNGEPLYFFHFSGFDPLKPERFSKHQNRFAYSALGDVQILLAGYARELLENDYAACCKWPYSYAAFANGFPIPDIGRRALRDLPGLEQRVADPFSEEGHALLTGVWNEVVDPRGGLTRLAYGIYRSREDVQAEMPDILGADRIRFLEWVVSSGKTEHRLDQRFLEPIEAALAAARPSAPSDSGPSPAAGPSEPDYPPICKRLFSQSESDAIWMRLREGVKGPLLESLNEELPDQTARLRFTRLARYIYESRPDLQSAFPDAGGRDSLAFLTWFLTYGRVTYHLGEEYVEPMRAQWDRLLRTEPNPVQRLRYRSLLLGMSVSLRMRRSLSGSRRSRLFPVRQPHIERHSASPGPSAANDPAGPEEPPVRRAEAGLHVIGYTKAEMGVGESARLASAAARAAGLDVRLKRVRSTGGQREQDVSSGPEATDFPYAVNLFRVNADQTHVVMNAVGPRFCQGRLNIGYWAWELEEFPDRWRDTFACYGEVWVPSTFCLESISRVAPVPVVRIPHAVQVNDQAQRGRDRFGLPPSDFLFLFLFDMFSVFERKNPVGAIQAFRQAFHLSDRCTLVLKVNHGDQFPAQLAALRRAAEGLRVHILDRTLPRDDVHGLIAACDCLVSLHRSEGFGLTMAEAMMLGKPVIATGYSGNLDFTRPENSFLVDYQRVPVGLGSEPYAPQAVWADPSIPHAARLMREVFENRDLRESRAAAGRRFAQENLSLEAVGALMKRRLEYRLGVEWPSARPAALAAAAQTKSQEAANPLTLIEQ